MLYKDAGLVDVEKLTTMRDSMIHRGPDDCGEYRSDCGRVGLAHRRLSIIDLSDSGRQPMTNEDGSVWVVFNGEVYNYRELMTELLNVGHRFISRSDTEVIVHAYEEWGLRFLNRLIGIFALVIWDSAKEQILLARDHMGVKPLYYYRDKERFVFASEYKAFLSVVPECKTPNYRAIYDFLVGTQYNLDDSAFFSHIHQLKPAHYGLLDLGKWPRFETKPYWKIDFHDIRVDHEYREPIEMFRTILDDAVKLQLRSDVPLGAFLSGGLDSSTLVGLASRQLSRPLQTFSAIYSDPLYGEGEYPGIMASSFPVIQKEIEPNASKMVSDIERFIWFQEMPTMGPGPFTEFCICEIASRDVTVVLSGQGPDEMLGGYHHCFEPYIKTRLRHVLSKPEKSGAVNLGRELGKIAELTGRPVAYFLAASMLLNQQTAIRNLKRRFRKRWLDSTFVAEYGNGIVDFEPPDLSESYLDNYLVRLQTIEGLPALLHYADRNSMCWSLELRVPFLDHRLVEFCAGLPFDWKIRDASTKFILRKAMEGRLPDKIIQRLDKKGFETPVSSWFKESEGWLRDVLSFEAVRKRGILKPKAVERLLNKQLAGHNLYRYEIWRFLNLELWFRLFMDDSSCHNYRGWVN